MSDGQDVPEEFLKKHRCYRCSSDNVLQLGGMLYCQDCYPRTKEKECCTTVLSVICHGCGAMIEDVVLGTDGWLFCPCGTGIMKVTI